MPPDGRNVASSSSNAWSCGEAMGGEEGEGGEGGEGGGERGQNSAVLGSMVQNFRLLDASVFS